MSSSNRNRPLSPHLTIWRWGPAMATSIIHRVTGSGLATVGLILFVWWLVALASGEGAYNSFVDVFTVKSGKLNILGYVFGIGLTLSFFQHMLSGVRHLVLDVGANYELKANKRTAVATWIGSVLLTVLFWAWFILVRG